MMCMSCRREADAGARRCRRQARTAPSGALALELDAGAGSTAITIRC